MSIIKVDTIKDESGAKTLVEQSGSNFAWGAGVPKGSVIEQFTSPCDGSAITVQSGSYTTQNVTAVQDLTVSWVALTGSEIAYTPPTGTQTVIYEFSFQFAYYDANPRTSFRILVDSTEVTNARRMISSNATDANLEGAYEMKWAFHIGGTASAAKGRFETWTSNKTILVQGYEYSTGTEASVHTTRFWENGSTDQFAQPVIGITSLA